MSLSDSTRVSKPKLPPSLPFATIPTLPPPRFPLISADTALSRGGTCCTDKTPKLVSTTGRDLFRGSTAMVAMVTIFLEGPLGDAAFSVTPPCLAVAFLIGKTSAIRVDACDVLTCDIDNFDISVFVVPAFVLVVVAREMLPLIKKPSLTGFACMDRLVRGGIGQLPLLRRSSMTESSPCCRAVQGASGARTYLV